MKDFIDAPIDRINNSGRWNIHPYLDTQPSPSLEQSIKRIGILHPPTLVRDKSHRYDVVCGRQRLECVKNTSPKIDYCLCRLLPATLPVQQILLYLLEDQMASAPLTLLDKAFFLHLCLQTMEMEEVATHFSPLLGMKKGPLAMTNLLKLCTLNRTIQQSIHLGIISDKIIYELVKLPQQDQLALENLFNTLYLGGGKQKRFFTLCKDHVLQSGKTISSLLEEEDIQFIVNHKQMNPPQKTNQLLSLLQKRCYPLQTAAEETFRSETQRMRLPVDCELSHTAAFEKDDVLLSVRFKNMQSFESFLPTLKDFYKKN